MYKLLVTTALVAMTATSASAWTDAKTVIDNLGTVYNNLDGQTEFNRLQGTNTDDDGTDDGELFKFVDTVNKGVTHLTLTVGGNNQITAKINEGSTLTEINNAADDLVNRVNYDVFVQDATDAPTYEAGTNYTGQDDLTLTPEVQSSPPTFLSNHNAGLLGRKVNTLITNVDNINAVLIGTDASGDAARAAFVNEWNGVDGDGNDVPVTVNTGITDIKASITNLNDVANLISSTDEAGFNNILNDLGDDFASGAAVNPFNVPGIAQNGEVQVAGGEKYDSLLDWAQGNVSTDP